MIGRTWLPSTEPTKQGREERHMLVQLRAPWALVARRAGRLHVRMNRTVDPDALLVALARYVEAVRTARMLAALAAHEPVSEEWTRG